MGQTTPSPSSGYPGQVPGRAPAPATGQPAMPPEVLPGRPGYYEPAAASAQPAGASAQPGAVQYAAARPAREVDAGRYWAGVAATAAVTALIGIAGVVLFSQVAHIGLVIRPHLFSSSVASAAIVGAGLALIAGLTGFGLAKAAPRPGVFFGWIMALLLVVGALAPFGWTRHLDSAIATAVVNAAMAAAAWSLVAVTLGRTSRTVPQAMG